MFLTFIWMFTFHKYTSTEQDDLVKLFMSNTPDWFATEELDHFTEYLNKLAQNYFVITHFDVTVGCGGFEYNAKENMAIITWTIIHPSYQRSGLGRQLIEYIMAKARHSHKDASFRVRTSQVAFGFFEKLGFKVIDTQRDHWAKGLDLYVMLKEHNI